MTTAQIYHQHHFTCRTCICAGKGYGQRCAIGLQLWRNYQDEPQGGAA